MLPAMFQPPRRPLAAALLLAACSAAAPTPDDPLGDDPAPGELAPPPPLVTLPALAAPARRAPLLGILVDELARATKALSARKPSSYFLAYGVYDNASVT